MLIDFKKAVAKHRMTITGVIHVGAHHGQEYFDYKAVGIDAIVFIEPCQKAFKLLKDTFGAVARVRLENCACGADYAEGTMNVEQANQGMSNSLLKPIKHLEQYPSIQFNDTERVRVVPLDSLKCEPYAYNMLVMDVQGFELEVLKGAAETLKHIDYIYTEVNRDEVYEGCAKVWELDAFLKDFTRVETSWAGGMWGDAIYTRNNIHNS